MSRIYMTVLAPVAMVIGALTAISPAFATDESFATYTGLNGTFGVVQTGTSIIATEHGQAVFSFLNVDLAVQLTGIKANVTFAASAPDASYNTGGIIDQGDVSGTYQFTSTTAYVIDGKTYAAGSNLLTVGFDNGDLFSINHGKTATLSTDSTIGGTVVYSSDFLSFATTQSRDFAIALSAINPKFGGVADLASFTATPVGVFSSDPGPLVDSAIPEPATWLMMLFGFGAIGLGIRRNARRDPRIA